MCKVFHNLIAEIIDIRRFVKDDNLASYAGLVDVNIKQGIMRKRSQPIFSIID